MKVIHTVLDEKFIDGAISLFDTDNGVENTYVLVSEDASLKFQYIKDKRVRIISLKMFDEIIRNYDVLVIHSLPSLPLDTILKIPKNIKVVWYAWGFDIYDGKYPLLPLDLYMPETKKLYKKCFRSYNRLQRLRDDFHAFRMRVKKKKAISRVDYFSGVYPYEYNLLKEKYSLFKAKPLDFYYGAKTFFIKDEMPMKITNRRKNLIIGNSANVTNNHIDIIRQISKYYKMPKGGSVIIPLSYGGPKSYVDSVKWEAFKTFDNVNTLETFLPLDEYLNLVSSCGVAIFGHIRQQASDNIFMQIMYGAKVFMPENAISYKYLRSLGLYVYSLSADIETINDSLTDEQIIHNRRILTDLYSESKLVERVKTINTTLLNR